MLIRWSASVKSGLEASKQVYELARIIKENKETELKPVVSQVSSLLDILNSPLGDIISTSLPFISMITTIIIYIKAETQQEITLAQSVGLVAQAAYLESIQSFFRSHFDLTQTLTKEPASEELSQEIKQLGQGLKLNQEEAKQVLVCFHESSLAKYFNHLLQKRLEESNIETDIAKIIVERISRKTYRYLKPNFAKIKDKISELVSTYGNDWKEELTFNYSLEKYLKEKIDREETTKVFDETFSFNDIYVPLKIQNSIEGNTGDKNLESWAINHLLNPKKSKIVLFVQAKAGQGKSVFCRMLAKYVRQNLYPIYTPILIRLQDVKTIEETFEKTLESAINWDFVTDCRDWLQDKNTQFLFILDGLDELSLEGNKTDGLRRFLGQVSDFQTQCHDNAQKGHRIIMTGRPSYLYEIDQLNFDNLESVAIASMDDETQEKWLENWEKIVGEEEVTALRRCLFNQRYLDSLKALSREPLLLYLLAAMHRDGQLNLDNFIHGKEAEIKVNIYQKAVAWILTKKFQEDESQCFSSLKIENLHSILVEAGFCILQLGQSFGSIKMIEDRLVENGDESAIKLLNNINQGKESASVNNALATFYFNKSIDANHYIQFLHRSFAEFLAAECLAENFEEWTQTSGSGKRPYLLKDREFKWQIYDLLGYGYLTFEVFSYLMPLLEKRQIDWLILYERLYEFYLSWSDGKFIEVFDSSEDILPLKKARQLQKYNLRRGQRQIDIYTGLNVLMLLLGINRYAQKNEKLKGKINFYPCGHPDNQKEFDANRLLKIIGYSDCLKLQIFNRVLGKFLSFANLQKANLKNVDLRDVDLRYVNLKGAELNNIQWNEQTQWEGIKGLDTACGIPAQLENYLQSQGLLFCYLNQ